MPATLVFDYPTVAAIAGFVDGMRNVLGTNSSDRKTVECIAEYIHSAIGVFQDETTTRKDDQNKMSTKSAEMPHKCGFRTLASSWSADFTRVHRCPLEPDKVPSKTYRHNYIMSNTTCLHAPGAFVFLAEFMVTIVLYLSFYRVRSTIYGISEDINAPMLQVQTLALFAQLVHSICSKFMMITLSRNNDQDTISNFHSSSYFGYFTGCFAAMSCFINHPVYVPVGLSQIAFGVSLNGLIHVGQLCQSALPIAGPRKHYPRIFGYSIRYHFFAMYSLLGFNVATQTAFGWLLMCCTAANLD